MSDLNFPRYREDKALAAVSKLLVLSGNKCDKYWLNKLMYYVERLSLIKGGKPLIFDRLYSIPYGPIASSVNDGIDLSAYPADSSWTKLLSLNGKLVTLKEEADYSILSPFEIGLIEESFNKFKGWGFDRLHEFFKNLPEYKNTTSREEINYEEILSAEGYDPQSVKETINEIYYFDLLESSLDCAE